ncbi:MAG: hypothetical protein LBR68_06240 [Lachnoclostridium sp.]|nr:hypothetical protein [Lachnoclostridium sp.]
MKMIYNSQFVLPVEKTGGTLTGMYESKNEGRQSDGGFHEFSQIMKEKKERQETIGYEKSKPGSPISFYNREAQVFFLLRKD